MDVFKKKKDDVGGCSACHNRDCHVVWEIDLNSTIVRLCNRCKKELINKLKSA